MQPRHGLDQHVWTLKLPELADEDEIGGVSLNRNRCHLVGADAVVDHPHDPAR